MNGHKRFFVMSEFNQVILSLQKIKSKNLGQNQENLVNYLVKCYSFSSDKAEIVIVEAVKANVSLLLLKSYNNIKFLFLNVSYAILQYLTFLS